MDMEIKHKHDLSNKHSFHTYAHSRHENYKIFNKKVYLLFHVTNENCTNLPHDGVLEKARLEDTTAGAGAWAELKGDELHVITQLLDNVAALTGVMLLRLRLLTLLLQIYHKKVSNTTNSYTLYKNPTA
jgi:hypothetical protein